MTAASGEWARHVFDRRGMDRKVEIRLYGDLRERSRSFGVPKDAPVQLPIDGTSVLSGVLDRLGIGPDELGNVFLNGRMLYSISVMQVWLMYPTEMDRYPESGRYLDTVIQSGDRLGLFPRRMGLLVI